MKDNKIINFENILIAIFSILIIITAAVLLNEKPKTYCLVNINQTALTNQNVKLFVYARGDNAKIRTENGSIINSDYYELEVTENGEYTFAAVSGNKTQACSFNVNNIDREKPKVSITPSTKNRVLALDLQISASDNFALAEKPYSWDNKTWTNSKQKRITANGTYTIYVKDSAGNISNTSYKISNIGNPIISSTLTMNINTTKNLSADNNVVKSWISNNSNVVSVTTSGVVTAKIRGVATITAILTNGDMYTWAINVVKPNVTSIALNTNNIQLKPGTAFKIFIKQIVPNNTMCDNVSWKSNNTAIAKINNGTITAIAEGTATITVMCDQVSASATVIVKKSENPIIPTSNTRKYESVTLKYYVQNKGAYYLTYIWMEDPYSQIKKLDANTATYGQILTDQELTGKTLKRLSVGQMLDSYIASGRIPLTKGLVAFNASGFYVKGSWNPPSDYYNLKSDSWFVINEGITTRNVLNDNQANRNIIGIDANGILKYYGTAVDANGKTSIVNAINNDRVRNTFSFGPLLVQNRNIVGGGSAFAHRQAICQINGNNYVMLTTINKISLDNVASALLNIGCINAFNLDGGGSTSMFYKSNTSTTATKYVCRDGSTGTYCRSIVEGIYFVEK